MRSNAVEACRATVRSSKPASAPSAARRCGTANAEFACNVVPAPWCPVFMALSRCRISEPRHSPTMSRSGAIRRACTSRSPSVISPAPSAFAARVLRLTVCGCCGLSSGVSSRIMRRSQASHSPRSALRSVVFPVPVPPLTTKFCRRAIMVRRACSVAASNMPLSRSAVSVKQLWAGRRIDRCVFSTSGGMTA